MAVYEIRLRALSSYMATDADGEIQINTGSASDSGALISDPLVDTARWFQLAVMGLNPDIAVEADAFTTLGRRAAQSVVARRTFTAQTERMYFPADFAAYEIAIEALASNYVALYVETYDVTLQKSGYVTLCRPSFEVSHVYDDGSKRLQITLANVEPT